MSNIEVALFCGGGGSEHDISLVSAKFLLSHLQKMSGITPHYIEITKDFKRLDESGNPVSFNKDGYLSKNGHEIYLNYAIPCLHGPPGENGHIQAVYEMMRLPYFGSSPEASCLSFNKVSTKLWLDKLGIPNTPYEFLSSLEDMPKAEKFFENTNKVFIKASSQGSSVGCYTAETLDEMKKNIKKAFEHSPYVLVESKLEEIRELEIAVYQRGNEVVATSPGEILCPGGFYTFEEKYNEDSQTTTTTKPEGLNPKTIEQMKEHALKAFHLLKLKHLSRVDFFLKGSDIYINEINTFPGMTPISMFPQLLEENGDQFTKYLEDIIKAEAREAK